MTVIDILKGCMSYHVSRLREASTWAALAIAAVVLDQNGVLPASWHPYVLAFVAAAAALGIYIPARPAPNDKSILSGGFGPP